MIWTITPALILILIAFPSFKLLYLMDEVSDPAISVLAEGLYKSYTDIYLYLYLPARVYGNSDVQKFDIYKENKDKSILISGFADAESCFSVFIDKNRKLKRGWSVQPYFVITLHIKPPATPPS